MKLYEKSMKLYEISMVIIWKNLKEIHNLFKLVINGWIT